jgi:hypothetical protein
METANTISLATTFPTQARPYPMERLKGYVSPRRFHLGLLTSASNRRKRAP